MNLEPLHDKLNREHPRFSAHLTFAERDAIVRTIIHSIGDVAPDVDTAPRATGSEHDVEQWEPAPELVAHIEHTAREGANGRTGESQLDFNITELCREAVAHFARTASRSTASRSAVDAVARVLYANSLHNGEWDALHDGETGKSYYRRTAWQILDVLASPSLASATAPPINEQVEHVGYHAERNEAKSEHINVRRERAFAAMWTRANEGESYRRVLELLLSNPEAKDPIGLAYHERRWIDGPMTARDAKVAATVAQWFGSNVGFSYLCEALESVGIHVPLSPVAASATAGDWRESEDVKAKRERLIELTKPEGVEDGWSNALSNLCDAVQSHARAASPPVPESPSANACRIRHVHGYGFYCYAHKKAFEPPHDRIPDTCKEAYDALGV